ncbi:hypothetical protein Taro_045451 [Colocasia esculenta]|uniref:Uncharacterized protein n=1 Tax=Colocasia esculenta TaxID=4460 RepID=A0A843WM40_COLES|nr:hypothetical protein [Colocasia esculenta]
MQAQQTFLEDWLRSSGGAPNSSTSPPPSQPASRARAILHAWAELRDYSASSPADHCRCLDALRTLLDAQDSVHVADPQAKLLLSILSSPSPSPPECLPPIFRLLYIWVRRSARPAPPLLESAASAASSILSPPAPFPAQGILLLGALSAAPGLSEASRGVCLDRLCRLLEEERGAIGSAEELVPEVLAGIGYALLRSKGDYFTRVLYSLFGIWGGEVGPRANLAHGLMILSLVEWLVAGFINSRAMGSIELLCRGVSAENLEVGKCARFPIVMASAGILRAFRRVPPGNTLQLSASLRRSIEGSVAAVANYVLSRTRNGSVLDDDPETRCLLQCIAVGLARCGPFNFHAPVLLCVCLALLNEFFPFLSFFRRVLESPNLGAWDLCLKQVRGHAGSILFKEAGAVSGVLCNMYFFADGGSQAAVENYVWGHCEEFYGKHRLVALLLKGRQEELLRGLDEIAESFFLMVVLFSAEATKRKLEPKISCEIKSGVSVRVLISFSCIEYQRRIRLPEYTDAVRRAVLALQENGTACVSFVESMPSYVELISVPGSDSLAGKTYVWSEDEVQTARMLFYLRVIPTCITHIPGDIFGQAVAPTMFLYMHHQLEKVARASHSVFAAFISSGKDYDENDEMGLKEKLVFYYMQRSLDAYPGATPFEGMASGVAALVRHLPAGSPATFYCVNSLIEKVTVLCGRAMSQDAEFWKNWQRDSEPCKKVLDLLLRLISLVDIQVLPYLLKLLAQFIGQLPKEGQNVILGDLHAHVADSDDVVRKPTLVSWLQSLCYLSSQMNSATHGPTIQDKKLNNDKLNYSGASSFAGSHSRL